MVPVVAALDAIMNVARFSKGVDLFLDMVGGLHISPASKLTSDYEAGVKSLRSAGSSLMDKERKSLLREARSRFHKAQNQEQGLSLARSLLGLAVCHQHLGENLGAKNALESLLKVEARQPGNDPDHKAPYSSPSETESLIPDEATAEARSLLAFLSEEKTRLQSNDETQDAVVEELERYALRVKKKGVILFIQQLIAEKKKIQVAAGKERAAVEELEKVVHKEADRLVAKENRRKKASQDEQPPPDDPRAVAARDAEKLEALKQSVQGYLKNKTKLTYNSEYEDWT